MNLIIIKNNHQGISTLKNGSLEIVVLDPKHVDEKLESLLADVKVDQVMVSKELSTEDQTKALRYAYKAVKYYEGKLNKVVLI